MHPPPPPPPPSTLRVADGAHKEHSPCSLRWVFVSASPFRVFTLVPWLASPLQLKQGPLLIFKISFNMEPFLRVQSSLLILFMPGVELISQCRTSPRWNTGPWIARSGGQCMAPKVELQLLFLTAWGEAVLPQASGVWPLNPFCTVWPCLHQHPAAVDNAAKHGLSPVISLRGLV